MRIVTCSVGSCWRRSRSRAAATRHRPRPRSRAPQPVGRAARAGPLAPPAPTATDAPAEATSTATGLRYGTPHPRPVVDADDCAHRWNAATNAAVRAEVAGARRGASVGVEYDAERRCRRHAPRWRRPTGPGGSSYVEFAAGVFRSPGGASGITSQPERSVTADGRIGGDPPSRRPRHSAGRDRVPGGHRRWGGAGRPDAGPRPGRRHGRLRASLERRPQRARPRRGRGPRTRRLRAAGATTASRAARPGRAGRLAGGIGGGLYYVEVTTGAFRELASTGSITAQPERDVDGEGGSAHCARAARRRPPSRASPTSASARTAGRTAGASTWTRPPAATVDAAGGGRGRRAPLRFVLGFEPTESPVLTIPRGADPVQAPLPRPRTIDWTRRPTDRPLPRHARRRRGRRRRRVHGVPRRARSRIRSRCPGLPLSHVPGALHGGDVTRPDRSEPDAAAACPTLERIGQCCDPQRDRRGGTPAAALFGATSATRPGASST